MSARKGSIGGVSDIVGGSSSAHANKRVSPTNSELEYSAAIAVLSDATMSQACELLLSERDYNADHPDDGVDESDCQKLLHVFSKCEAACKVIQQRAAVMIPTLPRGPAPAARAQAQPVKPKAKTMLPPRRGALITSVSHARGPASSLPPPPIRTKLQRETSDSSSSSVRSLKKARISPPTLDTNSPPPSAMSFLAALNKKEKRQSPTKPPRTTSPPPQAPPPPQPPSATSTANRRQPPRTVRKTA